MHGLPFCLYISDMLVIMGLKLILTSADDITLKLMLRVLLSLLYHTVTQQTWHTLGFWIYRHHWSFTLCAAAAVVSVWQRHKEGDIQRVCES